MRKSPTWVHIFRIVFLYTVGYLLVLRASCTVIVEETSELMEKSLCNENDPTTNLLETPLAYAYTTQLGRLISKKTGRTKFPCPLIVELDPLLASKCSVPYASRWSKMTKTYRIDFVALRVTPQVLGLGQQSSTASADSTAKNTVTEAETHSWITGRGPESKPRVPERKEKAEPTLHVDPCHQVVQPTQIWVPLTALVNIHSHPTNVTYHMWWLYPKLPQGSEQW